MPLYLMLAILKRTIMKSKMIPSPEDWFTKKYDVDSSRMALVEHKGSDVIRFISEYINDIK